MNLNPLPFFGPALEATGIFFRKLFQKGFGANELKGKDGGIVILSIDDQGFRTIRHQIMNGVLFVWIPVAMMNEELLQHLETYFSQFMK